MSKIKLIALDIDGTLMNSQREISVANREAIRMAEAQGIPVILATGRMYRSARQFKDLFTTDLPVIAYNGAMIRNFEDGEILYQQNMPPGEVRPIYERAKDYGLHTNFYINDTLIAHEGHDWIQGYAEHVNVPYQTLSDQELLRRFEEGDIIKMVAMAEEDKVDYFLEKEYNHFKNRLYLVKSLPFFLEIAHLGVNKGTGLLALGESWGIDPQDMMAIGDNLNDQEMLELVGHPVIMANGHESLKNRGWFQTRTADEDGVAHAIHTLI